MVTFAIPNPISRFFSVSAAFGLYATAEVFGVASEVSQLSLKFCIICRQYPFQLALACEYVTSGYGSLCAHADSYARP